MLSVLDHMFPALTQWSPLVSCRDWRWYGESDSPLDPPFATSSDVGGDRQARSRSRVCKRGRTDPQTRASRSLYRPGGPIRIY
jgi:hypothetical protein